jgi:hypothetical protein
VLTQARKSISADGRGKTRSNTRGVVPDLVGEVMMPKVAGISVATELKQDYTLSHIV